MLSPGVRGHTESQTMETVILHFLLSHKVYSTAPFTHISLGSFFWGGGGA